MATTWGMLEQRGRGLAEEAAVTVGCGRLLDPAWLDSAAGWLAEGARPWTELAGASPTGREYRLIVSSLHLEAWLICWPEDGRLALHDHGGASGALRVIDGTLTEQYVPGGRLPAQRRTLSAGGGINFDGEYIHDVANRHHDLATSVHVYGAARRPMAYYELDSAGIPRPLEGCDDAVVVAGSEDAVVASTVRSRAVHPAGSER